MALRNLFDNLATEGGLRRIANLLTFARDAQDRIRAVVDSGSVTIYNRASSTNLTSSDGTQYNTSTTWNITDARDPLRQSYRANVLEVRNKRWTIS